MGAAALPSLRNATGRARRQTRNGERCEGGRKGARDGHRTDSFLKQLPAKADVISTVTVVGNQPMHAHRHTAVKEHLLRQRRGIPYEVERTRCAGCREVLAERPLRRAAA
jgi:hypothetical protein